MAPFTMAVAFDKSKIDPEKRQVWGFATVEEPDRQGDIVDYNGSVEAFQRWAGNIREQHDPKKAIGKAVEIVPDPVRKGIWLGAYISKSPDGEGTWTKINEGILTGYSIKGSIHDSASEFGKDATGAQRRFNRIKKYSLDEVSVVDVPACPSATITLVKSVGDDPIATDVLGTPWQFLAKEPPMTGTANPFTGLTDFDRDDIAKRIARLVQKADSPSGVWRTVNGHHLFFSDQGGVHGDQGGQPGPELHRAKGDGITPDPAEHDALKSALMRDAKRTGTRPFNEHVGKLAQMGRYAPSHADAHTQDVWEHLHKVQRDPRDGHITDLGSIKLKPKVKKGQDAPPDDADDDGSPMPPGKDAPPPDDDNAPPDDKGKPKDDDDTIDGADQDLGRYDGSVAEKVLRRVVASGLQKDGGILPMMIGGSSLDITRGTTMLRLLAEWLESEQGEADDNDDDSDENDSTQIDALRQAVRLIITTLQSEFDDYYGKPGEAADAGEYAAAAGLMETALVKYGARHSVDDLHDVQKIHKLCVRLGATCDGNDNGDDEMAQKSVTGSAPDAGDDMKSAYPADSATARMTTGDQTVEHKKITPQFARDMHALSVTMGASCDMSSGPKPIDAPSGNKVVSSSAVAAKAADDDAALKVTRPDGKAQELHDWAADNGAHDEAAAYTDPAADQDDDDKDATKSMRALLSRFNTPAADAAEEIEMTKEELQALLQPQLQKSADNIDKLVGVIGNLADSMEKSNAKVGEVASTVDSLAARIAAIESQPAGTKLPVRQPPAAVVEKMATATSDNEDLDGQIAQVDAQMSKTDNPMQLEKLAFTRGFLEVKKQGTFRGWTPR